MLSARSLGSENEASFEDRVREANVYWLGLAWLDLTEGDWRGGLADTVLCKIQFPAMKMMMIVMIRWIIGPNTTKTVRRERLSYPAIAHVHDPSTDK